MRNKCSCFDSQSQTSLSIADVLNEFSRIHFVGIAGVGMSALAKIVLLAGHSVSGTDLKSSDLTDWLVAHGGLFSLENDFFPDPLPDIVVVSSAIFSDNPQVVLADKFGIPVFHRSELLGFVLGNKISVGVTGTHGKTTISALVSFLLTELDFSPTCLVGGNMLNFNTNSLFGSSDYFVAEVDESDKSLLNVPVKVAVLSNLEEDHLDVYSGLDDIVDTVRAFVDKLGVDASVVYNRDDSNLDFLLSVDSVRTVSFSVNDLSANVFAANLCDFGSGVSFDLFVDGVFIRKCRSPLPGIHNVYNVLAALSALLVLDCDLFRAVRALPKFLGTGRRIECLHDSGDIKIVDDYAHHPTEIRATLDVLSRKINFDENLVVVFQPHRYSRTAYFCDEYGRSFSDADCVIITDVYGAGESFVEDSDAKAVFLSVSDNRDGDTFCVSKDEILEFLKNNVRGKSTVAFLGAGDISKVAYEYRDFIRN